MRYTNVYWSALFENNVHNLGVQWLVTGAVPSRGQILYPKSIVNSLRAKSPTKANPDHHNGVLKNRFSAC